MAKGGFLEWLELNTLGQYEHNLGPVVYYKPLELSVYIGGRSLY